MSLPSHLPATMIGVPPRAGQQERRGAARNSPRFSSGFLPSPAASSSCPAVSSGCAAVFCSLLRE
eukprot:4078870-Alexandrium_andersonii.AAC.1